MLMATLFALLPALALPQTPRDAKVTVTVVDPSGGVIPGAAVTLTGLDGATAAARLDAIQTTENGLAVFERVTPGRYRIQAEFSGFEPGLLRDIRVNPGDNRRVVVLPLKNVSQEVTVGGG